MYCIVMKVPSHKKSISLGAVTLAYRHYPSPLNESVKESVESEPFGETSHTSPLVLLHGWPESSHSWNGVVQELQKMNYPGSILAIDLKGLGHS